MKEVKAYQCEECGRLFLSKQVAYACEEEHRVKAKVDKMFKSGATLGEINDAFNLWKDFPENLRNVSKTSRFKIPHWECCDDYIYYIQDVNYDPSHRIFVRTNTRRMSHGNMRHFYYGEAVRIQRLSDMVEDYGIEEVNE